MQASISTFNKQHPAFPSEFDLVVLTNNKGLIVTLSSYGASIWSVEHIGDDGVKVPLTIGYQQIEDWATNPYYFGVTVGRVANRIGQSRFSIGEEQFKLIENEGPNQLHGGPGGFSHRIWRTETKTNDDGVSAFFHLESADGDQGFPGTLHTSVEYRLTNDNELIINYHAVCDKTTPICLTNHTYWNLSSDELSGILYHHLQINADNILALDDQQIPNGDIQSVSNTCFDFRQPKLVGVDICEPSNGYDHYYIVNDHKADQLNFVAKLTDEASGREMEILSTEVGVQFYSGNFLDGSYRRENGEFINKHQGLCLETHGYPNAVNIEHFPTTIVEKNTPYTQTTVHRFKHL
ncbi:aldose epimerase family protein [Shewanella psychrotolerans]|uniref:aldose epimerase family protein n=1 Tax=Shewanella psychrotolerans TaxID=2864206 RepID=UPI001C65EBDB|nr:aldose epimerase family protein [Shewanella psychrotolerans]QYK03041.1 galactose mutarotase [Shewanella psychrotolerans]